MERVQSEPQLPLEPKTNILSASQHDDFDQFSQLDPAIPNRNPMSASEMHSNRGSKMINSRNQIVTQKSSHIGSADPEASKSQPKFLISKEDLDRINSCKETIARGKDFRSRAQLVNISVPIVPQTEKSFNSQSSSHHPHSEGERLLPKPKQPDEIDHFLNAINEIIHAEIINKHPVEIAQVEQITRVIKSSKGEQCRDLLRYVSNLRKQFNDCLGQLDVLTTSASARYAKMREIQIQQNNALSAELERVKKLTAALRSRDSENSSLKQQMEQLLETLKQRDVQQRSEQGSRNSNQQPIAFQQLVDDKREQDILSLSARLEQELNSNKALGLMERLKNELSEFMQENARLKINTQQLEMRYEAQSRNLAYLEDKLAATLTEREEQVVDLKSQIVIQKQKARSYKQKLKFELDEFKKVTFQSEQENCFKEKQMLELELVKMQAVLSERDAEIKEHEMQADRHRKRIEEIQKQFSEQLEARELKYQGLKDKLEQVERDHTVKLKSQVEKVASERRAMDRFEQEQTVKELRLEYLESNQKKMQQQKDFLEKQISKDIREMQQQMLKTKLEIKKDQLISSQSALSRLEQMYSMMQQSLRHVTRVVSFMTFDVDSQTNNLTGMSAEIPPENQLSTQQEGQIEISNAPGQNLFNEQNKSQGLTTEQLIQKHPLEMIESMAQWLHDMWQNSNGPPADDLEQMLNQLKLRTSSIKVDEISRNFLLQNRLHFEQFLFRLKEKNTALQNERDRLQKKLQEMHEEMQQVIAEYGNESIQDLQFEDKPEQEEEDNVDAQDVVPESQLKRLFKKSNGFGQNFHLKASVTKRLNEALTERIRDIKLILNRKYFELEDQMKLQKDKYEMEISQMRVQYGKDLNQVHMDCKKALHLQRKEMDEAHKVDFSRLKVQFSDQFKKLKSDFEDALKKLNKEKMQERYQKQQYFQELKKQKKESCGIYQGGYGTFTIAFENPVHTKLVKCQQQLVEHQQNLDILKASLQGAKTKLKQSMLLAHGEKEKQLQEEWKTLQQKMEQTEILPIEKLNHFIEVGFQISSRNYQSLMNYNDQAYESMAKKYVFEFQDALDRSQEENELDESSQIEEKLESRLLQKENLLRQQISDNFALFNEINPIYISLNLGRPVSTFPDISLPVENFRLAHRISSNVSGQYLTINFLKADLPFIQLRIIAFNNQTCQTYELDMTKEDILVFVESNLKFLEEENSTDLYHLIANSLTIITRKTSQRSSSFQIQILSVEHRMFFNELYRNNWDARNKKIKARHNKFKQGLIKEIACITDYNQSIFYEGFEDVFETEVCLDLGKDMADHFTIKLQRGMHSGHLKLVVKLMYSNDVEQTLCLMKSDLQGESKSQNLASTLIQKPDIGDHNQALAYIVSMEKLYGTKSEENVLVKISSLQKQNADTMRQFKWIGEGPPNLSSTKTVSEVILLTKKAGEPNQFCRVREFDILNTEVRAQLFSHSFGYQQVSADFGEIQTQQYEKEPAFGMLESIEDAIAYHEKPPSRIEMSESAMFENMGAKQLEIQNNQKKVGLVLPPPFEIEKSHKISILRQFTIVRVKSTDEEGEEQIESQYAHVAIYTSPRLIELQQCTIEIKLPELDLFISQDLSPMQVLDNTQFELLFVQHLEIEKYVRQIIDNLIVTNADESTLEIDPKIEPFSALVQQMKQSQFDETMAKIGNVQFQLEFPDTKILQVSKSDLVDCAKVHSIAMIGQRPFKITCYFLPNLRNKKVKQRNKFEFDCIYVQAFSTTLDKTFELVLTEHDIGTLVEMLQEATQHKTAVEYRINCAKLFNSQLTHQQLMAFVLEVLQFDPITPRIYASFEQLLEKMTERRRLEIDFMEAGGRFIKADPSVKQTDQNHSEFTRTLITSIEKDLSNSKIYIKVYKCSLQSLSGLSKLQIEIFDIEEPSIVFKIDYLTSQDGVGKQVLLERFSLLDEAFMQHNQDQKLEFNENGMNRGLIFSISETAFPHEINLMLLEPCSHIFWYQTVKDDKINLIERRSDRQAFAVHLERSLSQEIFRDIPRLKFTEVHKGYQKRNEADNQKMQIEVLKCQIQKLAAEKQGDLNLVYGRTLEYPSIKGFVEIRVFISFEIRKLCLEWIEKSQDDKILSQLSWQLQIISQAESSRYYQGSMRSSDGSRLVCQIEQAVAAHANESCLRISFHKIIQQDTLEPIFDLVIVDPNLIKADTSVRVDAKFELGVGYRDTLSSILKMDDISNDIALSKIQLQQVAPKIEPRKDPWSLIYRRVLKQSEFNFIISAMQHDTSSMLKLNVFDSNSMQQQIFVFNASDVLTTQELDEMGQKPELFKVQIKNAVNTRLKIRELNLNQEKNSVLIPKSNKGVTFSASFLNPSVIENQNSNKIALNQLFPGIEEFDIRRGCANSLFEPTNLFENITPLQLTTTSDPKQTTSQLQRKQSVISSQPALNDNKTSVQAKPAVLKEKKFTLLSQYQRDDYLFDVYQLLNPFELILKVQVYNMQTFQLVASAECGEEALKRELAMDQMSHLLEGHMREYLAQYLITNSHLDESRQLMLFQKSDLTKWKANGAT